MQNWLPAKWGVAVDVRCQRARVAATWKRRQRKVVCTRGARRRRDGATAAATINVSHVRCSTNFFAPLLFGRPVRRVNLGAICVSLMVPRCTRAPVFKIEFHANVAVNARGRSG